MKPESELRKDKRTAGNGVTLQHRHFAFIADTIAALPDADERARMTAHFGDACARTNSRFDRSRFVTACKP